MIRTLSAAFPFLWALLLAEVFGVSLFFQGIHDIRITAVIGGLLVFGFATAVLPGLRDGWRVPKTASAGLLALFAFYMALSTLWSSVPYISMVFTLIIGTLPFLFFCIVMASSPRLQARICAGAVGGVMVGLAGWALLQFFFFHGKYGERVHHPMLDPNNLAVVFVMGLLCVLGFFLQAKSRRQILIALPLMLLFYLALLATQSRGGILVAGACSVILSVFLFRESAFARFKLPFIALAVPAIFYAIDYSMGLNITESVSEMAVPSESVSVFGRHALWFSTLRMALDNFWTGTGLGTFYLHYAAYRAPQESSDGFFAHMDPLQFWAEMGIFAPIIFYSMLTAVLLRTSKALSAAAGQPAVKAEIAAPFCALLALLLHSHISFHLYVLPILFPAGVLLAYWYVATESALGAVRTELSLPRSRRMAFGIATVVFMFALVWIARAGAGIWLSTEAGAALAATDVPRAEKTLDLMDIIAPASYSSVPEYKGRLALLKLNIMDESVPMEIKQQHYRDGAAFFKAAEKLNPRSPFALNFEALLDYKAYRDGLNPEGEIVAISKLERLLAMDPLFVLGRVGLGEIYGNRGDERAKLAVLEGGLIWPKPKTPLTVRYLMDTAELSRKLKNEPGIYNRLFLEARNINSYVVKEKR